MFYNRGFEGITVFVNYYDYSGTLMASQSYGLDNLNQEKEEEEKQALKKILKKFCHQTEKRMFLIYLR